ncbi:hypothetical protein RvY_16664 [Ramazzottius varieornatus]|uniref:G-protein coupled receptors family 1 profile domain-containing protein n=1 Tax=Ramazzottius varieornatus TaxID=947166 RepID=A0A1D1W1Y9_RAMVA|nr:hypothetical protein RvY_16664 [Ramazzottius varieornatus]
MGRNLLYFLSVNTSLGQSSGNANFSVHEVYGVGLNVWLAVTLTITIVGGLLNYVLAATLIHQRTLLAGAGILISHALITAGTFLFVCSSIFSVQTFLARYYPPSLTLCRATGWLYYVLIQATHWSAAPIAFNRFVAVTFPHRYKLITSKAAIICMLSWCWIFAIVCESLPLWGIGGIIDSNNDWKSCILRTNGRREQIVALLTASSWLPQMA